MLVRHNNTIDLATEMVSKMPQDLFDSEVSTFVDPSIATGAYLEAVSNRLKSCGHDKYNIDGRLFAYGSSKMLQNLVKKRNNIEPTFIQEKFLETKMKFDVVIGNPPYQSATDGKERNIGAPLWPLFVAKSFDVITDDGVVAMVTPATWLNKAKRGLWSTLSQHDITYLEPNAKRFFPSVGGNGGTFCYYVVNKSNTGSMTELPDGSMIDIRNTVLPKNNLEINQDNIKQLNSMLSRVVSIEVKSGPVDPSINSEHWSSTKTDSHIYETYYSGRSDRRSIWCDQPVGDHGKLKLVVASSGSIYNTMEITTKGVGRQANYVLGTQKELEDLQSLLISEDSKTLANMMQEGNFNNALNFIVQEEIDYVE